MKPDIEEDIRDFHKMLEVEPETYRKALSWETMKFRVQFLQEELDELSLAYAMNKPDEIFDALIDLVYVALGTMYLMDLPFYEGWAEVHKANMLKRRAKDATESKRGSSLDAIKDPGWPSPDLSKIIEGK